MIISNTKRSVTKCYNKECHWDTVTDFQVWLISDTNNINITHRCTAYLANNSWNIYRGEKYFEQKLQWKINRIQSGAEAPSQASLSFKHPVTKALVRHSVYSVQYTFNVRKRIRRHSNELLRSRCLPNSLCWTSIHSMTPGIRTAQAN